MIQAVYGSFDLAINGYEVTDLDVNQMPEIRVNKYNLARSDGEKVTAKTYGAKTIKLKGRITVTNSDDMTTKLETLKAALLGVNKYLDIIVRNEPRRYLATVTAFSTTVSGYSCFYEATFSCNSVGIEVGTSAMTFTSPITTNSNSHVTTFGGNYNALPTIDITLNSCDNYWTTKYLEFSNVVLGKKFRLTRTWGWTDRVVINSENKTAQIYAATKTVISTCDSITGFTSSHTLSLESTLMKEGVGCTKQVMAGAAILLSLSRLNATAVDLSSTSGYVLIPIFIPTPSAGAVASISFYAGSNTTLATNYLYWDITTQFDGSALATNAWNYVRIDLSAAATGTSGTAVRTAIISTRVDVNGTSAAMQLNGVLIDYLSVYKTAIVAAPLDYEGIFLEFEPGSGTVTYADEFVTRSLTVSGTYKKRYI